MQRRTRIDVFRQLLDKRLFAGRTFANINQPGKPIIPLNATDMASGEVFAFTAQRFNDICSDLAHLPLSVGVASSAAFPIVLSPMTLRYFSGGTCADAVPRDEWIVDDLTLPLSRYLNLDEYKEARYANALRHGPNAFRNIQYLHLIDGGVADNQGVKSLLRALTSPHDSRWLLNAINDGAVRNIVVIVVNARSEPPNEMDAGAAAPGIISMLKTVTSVPIDVATASLIANLKFTIESLMQDLNGVPLAKHPKSLGFRIRIYGIQIDFDQFHPDQNGLRDQVKAIGTTWTLSADQRDVVARAGTLLLRQDPCFNRFLADLKVTGVAVDARIAQVCAVVDVER